MLMQMPHVPRTNNARISMAMLVALAVAHVALQTLLLQP